MLAVHHGAAAQTVLAAFTAAVTETQEMRAECHGNGVYYDLSLAAGELEARS